MLSKFTLLPLSAFILVSCDVKPVVSYTSDEPVREEPVKENVVNTVIKKPSSPSSQTVADIVKKESKSTNCNELIKNDKPDKKVITYKPEAPISEAQVGEQTSQLKTRLSNPSKSAVRIIEAHAPSDIKLPVPEVEVETLKVEFGENSGFPDQDQWGKEKVKNEVKKKAKK